MKKSVSLALTLTLSGMLALPAAVSAEEDAAPSGGAAIGQFTPGFVWCRVQQSFRAITTPPQVYTWAYLENCGSNTGWIGCNDDECEKTLLSAAASGHYLGVNFTGTGWNDFNSVRLYKF